MSPACVPSIEPACDRSLLCYLLRRNVVGGVAGITADANSLVNYARQAAQRHLFMYNEDIPVELLAQRLCDLKQGYTQYGGTSSVHAQCLQNPTVIGGTYI